MGKKKTLFGESLRQNSDSHMMYFFQIMNLAISTFKWVNLPETIDERFLEMVLFQYGKIVFFEDEVIGPLALCAMDSGNFNVYGIPTRRRAYSPYNHYTMDLDASNSVLCYNNMSRTPSYQMAMFFARKLYELDRTIDVNCRAQKTPVLVQGSEKQRLTLKNLYQKYDGNEPFIFGDDSLNPNALKAIVTGAPFVSDKIYTLKTQIWNECLTFLGIPNINSQKKERMVTDEVLRNQGGAIASRYSRLNMREHACEEINKMFGWDVSIEYRPMKDPLSEEQDEPQEEEVNEPLYDRS